MLWNNWNKGSSWCMNDTLWLCLFVYLVSLFCRSFWKIPSEHKGLPWGQELSIILFRLAVQTRSKRYRQKFHHISQRSLKCQKFKKHLFKNLSENWQWGGNKEFPAKKGLKDVIWAHLLKVFFPKAAILVDWRKAACKTVSHGMYEKGAITVLIFSQSLL